MKGIDVILLMKGIDVILLMKGIEEQKSIEQKLSLVLRPGFEPESSARKAGMIGRTTLPELFVCIWACYPY
jgi:hypothetical protein